MTICMGRFRCYNLKLHLPHLKIGIWILPRLKSKTEILMDTKGRSEHGEVTFGVLIDHIHQFVHNPIQKKHAFHGQAASLIVHVDPAFGGKAVQRRMEI
jgi:hypothetical protein